MIWVLHLHNTIIQNVPGGIVNILGGHIISISQTRAWWTLHANDLYPFHSQHVQNPHPGDNAMHLEFCHWLHANHQLLPLILFTGEVTFTCNRINNIRNSHRWSHDNPHGILQTKFQHRFSINLWCSMINDVLIGPVILHNHLSPSLFPVAPIWSIGHPWNALFHFSFLILDSQ
jgi:hypothetical protein